MKKQEIQTISKSLENEILKDLKGSVPYKIFKNKRLIKEELEAIEEATPKVSEEWKEIQSEIEKELHDEYGEKIKAEIYFPRLEEELEKRITEKEYQERISNLDKHNDFLNTDAEIEFQKITEKEAIENLSFEQMELLDFMIE